MVKIKICGISQTDNLQTVIAAGADYVGFVFFPPSPRCVTIDQAAALSESAQDRITRIGLFVDPGLDEIAHVLEHVGLDMIQLHGKESPQWVAEIRKKFARPVIKAIGIAGNNDLTLSQDYWNHADVILFDAKPKPDDKIPGGLGRRFPHQILNQAQNLPPRWWLSGGIDADNVREILRDLTILPEAVDVSSAVESETGVKSNQKIIDFIKAVRQ